MSSPSTSEPFSTAGEVASGFTSTAGTPNPVPGTIYPAQLAMPGFDPAGLTTTGPGATSGQGTRDPDSGTKHPRPLVALDFGAGGKLAVFGEHAGQHLVGALTLPRLKPRGRGAGARTEAEKFADRLELLLGDYDVVTESATIGSSGAEARLVDQMLAASPGRLFLLPTRAVKNWVKDRGIATLTPGVDARPSDPQCAEILYRIAVTNPVALRPYTGKSGASLVRAFRSVRPADKRSYRGEYAGVPLDEWIALLPEITTLPVLADSGATVDLAQLLGDEAAPGGYRRAMVFPLAVALAEEPATDRDGFERVVGLYGHGYPSFYRRCTVELMQEVAKAAFGHELVAAVTPAERKVAWRLTRRAVRHLYRHADRSRARSLAARSALLSPGPAAPSAAA